MKSKFIGAILLGAAGLTAAIGAVGAQIAYALELNGFFAGNITGLVPPGPEGAVVHWLVYAAVGVLGVLGLFFLFVKQEE